MKKLYYLLVLALILGLVLTGCVLLNPVTPSINLEKGDPITGNEVCIDLAATALGLSPGDSIEGVGILLPYLTISSLGNVVVLADGDDTAVTYGAPNGATSRENGCIGTIKSDYGFGDLDRNHDYTFTFTSGVTVNSFSLRMLDFGDFFKYGGTNHAIKMTAYDTANNIVGTADQLTVTGGRDLTTGDACTASEGQPGNYVFEVDGPGIVKVEIEPVASIDPNIGFNDICFTINYVPLPSIEIVKTADPTMIHAKDEVIYTYVVTNTGSLDLMVDVSDDILGSIVSDVSLAAGASETYTSSVYPTSDTTNTGTATGTDMFGQVIESNDSASVDVLYPDISVEKSGPEAAAPGDIVTYAYTVINVGDCTLYNVSLVDDIVGPIALGLTELAQGAQVTVSADYLVTFDDPEWLENTATAEGTDELDKTVTATDSWRVHTMGARTIGYWKNHPDDWCDFPRGSMFVGETWETLSQFFPGSGAQEDGVNPLEMLRAQLIAAELNFACFEDDFHYARYEAADIFGTMRAAEVPLRRVYEATDNDNDDLNAFWSKLSKQQQKIVKQITNPLKDILEEFNEMGDEIWE